MCLPYFTKKTCGLLTEVFSMAKKSFYHEQKVEIRREIALALFGRLKSF